MTDFVTVEVRYFLDKEVLEIPELIISLQRTIYNDHDNSSTQIEAMDQLGDQRDR